MTLYTNNYWSSINTGVEKSCRRFMTHHSQVEDSEARAEREAASVERVVEARRRRKRTVDITCTDVTVTPPLMTTSCSLTTQ